MSPKEIWGRYIIAKQNAARCLMEACSFQSEVDWEDVYDAFEMAHLWKMAICLDAAILMPEFQRMLEATNDWQRRVDDIEGGKAAAF